MNESEIEKEQSPHKDNPDTKRYLPYKAKGDIDDFLFEGNCILRHSEK